MTIQKTILLITAVILVISIAYLTTRGKGETEEQWYYLTGEQGDTEPCADPQDSITIYRYSEDEQLRHLLDGVGYDAAEVIWDTTIHVDDLVDLIGGKSQ